MADTAWRLTEEDMVAVNDLREQLLAYARKMTCNTADAEDILSDTIMAAGQLFEHRSPIRHFLFTVMRRRVWGYLRRNSSGSASVISDPDHAIAEDTGPDTHVQKLGHATDLVRALATVPAPYHEPTRLLLLGYSAIEITEALGVKYNTVRSRIARGKEHLLKELGPEAPAQDKKPSKGRKRKRAPRSPNA